MLKLLIIHIIKIIHLTIIFYIFFGPFYSLEQLKNVITLLLFILYRWLSNDHKCNLTILENKLTGNNNGFIFRFINPIFKINESSLNKKIYFITFVWLLVLILYLLEYKM